MTCQMPNASNLYCKYQDGLIEDNHLNVQKHNFELDVLFNNIFNEPLKEADDKKWINISGKCLTLLVVYKNPLHYLF